MSNGNIATLESGAVLPSEARWRFKPSLFLSVSAIGRFLASCLNKDMIALNLLAFLLGRVSIMGELMPFGLAYFIAVTKKKRTGALAAGAWTLAGSLSIGYSTESACYLLSMVAYLWLTAHETRWQKKTWAVPIIVIAGGVGISIALLLWQSISLYQLLLVGFNLAASLVLATIFSTVLPLLDSAWSGQASEEQVVCLIILLAAGIAGVGQVQIIGYSLRNVLSGFFIMVLTLQGGVGIGVSVGTAVGIVAGLNEGNVVLTVAYYALASLVSGAFSSLGKFAIALGYMTGCVIAVSYFTGNERILAVIVETVAAALLFLAVPGNWWDAWRKKLCQTEPVPANPNQAVTVAAVKLSQISEMFIDLAGTFGQVRETASEPAEDIRQVIDRLGAQVCRACSRRDECWERQFYSTYQAFLDLISLAPTVKLDIRALPQTLKDSCQRQQQLLTAASEIIEHNRVTFFWQKRAIEHRAMLAEQMRSAGSIVATLAAEIQRVAGQDRQAELYLSAATLAAGCELESVKISGSGCDLRIVGRKQPCRGDQACMNKVMPLVAEILGQRLTVAGECGSRPLRRKCRLTLSAASRYAIDVGAASIAKAVHDISGDTCSVSEAGQGRVAAIISDGMGSGADAARESQAAVRFLEKLLAADFSVDAAAKSVNAMLLLRLPGESYATIDVAIFDLYSGEVEFLKTGSAVSYIKRVREVSVVQSTSLPVGIIEQVEIEPQRRQLAPGDTVVMVSDGVTEADRQKPRRDWVANFLRMAPDDNPQRLANLLIEQAQKLAGAAVNDDMTVLVIKIQERPGASSHLRL
jgi:stage II sporulation protein E